MVRRLALTLGTLLEILLTTMIVPKKGGWLQISDAFVFVPVRTEPSPSERFLCGFCIAWLAQSLEACAFGLSEEVPLPVPSQSHNVSWGQISAAHHT